MNEKILAGKKIIDFEMKIKRNQNKSNSFHFYHSNEKHTLVLWLFSCFLPIWMKFKGITPFPWRIMPFTFWTEEKILVLSSVKDTFLVGKILSSVQFGWTSLAQSILPVLFSKILDDKMCWLFSPFFHCHFLCLSFLQPLLPGRIEIWQWDTEIQEV